MFLCLLCQCLKKMGTLKLHILFVWWRHKSEYKPRAKQEQLAIYGYIGISCAISGYLAISSYLEQSLTIIGYLWLSLDIIWLSHSISSYHQLQGVQQNCIHFWFLNLSASMTLEIPSWEFFNSPFYVDS